LIQQVGAEPWQVSLLDVLQGNTSHELINPYLAINIDPLFAVEHPTVWSKEQWIQGNVMLISQLGTEQWLRLLPGASENGRNQSAKAREERPNMWSCDAGHADSCFQCGA